MSIAIGASIAELAIGRQPVRRDHCRMASNWISKLGSGLSDLLSYRPGDVPGGELDGDVRRVRQELDAIRARFPDHA
jgi:hypothetical protein